MSDEDLRAVGAALGGWIERHRVAVAVLAAVVLLGVLSSGVALVLVLSGALAPAPSPGASAGR